MVCSCKNNSTTEVKNNQIDSLVVKLDTIQKVYDQTDAPSFDSRLISKEPRIKDSVFILRSSYDPGEYNIHPYYLDFVEYP